MLADDAELDGNQKPKQNATKRHLVGLTNYGGTCYLNSFLQLYFRCPELVNAIYSLPPGVDDVIRELQALFAELQLGLRNTAEPAGLISALNLSMDEQQDANEFRLLFMDLLDEHLRSTSRIIERLFVGSNAYITRCCNCGYESESPNKFQELLISLQHSAYLEQCLRQTLMDEPMVGADQVACPRCEGRHDGSRTMRLTRLPMELCFQIMRFSYDTKHQRRQKLRSPLVYPLHLDMQPFLDGAQHDAVCTNYLLKGVLLHLGAQATGGHYVAFIHDYGSGWIVCNDADVTPMRAKTFRRQEELLAKSMCHKLSLTKQEKALRVEPHQQVSLNAYMLMYERADVADQRERQSLAAVKNPKGGPKPPSLTIVPTALAESIYATNALFEQARTAEQEMGELRWQLRNEAAHKLPNGGRDSSEELSFVTTDFLRGLFVKPSSSGTIEALPPLIIPSLRKYLCPHNKLSPESVGPYVKVVHRDALNQVLTQLQQETERSSSSSCDKSISLEMFTEGVLSGEAALCADCVRLRCWRLRVDRNILRDQEELDRARVADYQGPKGFWVGRQSLKSWKSQARTMAEQMGCNKYSPPLNGDFNQDLLCEHDQLSPETRVRRLVSPSVWERLLAYFPQAREFPACSAQSCLLCSKQHGQLVDDATQQRDGVLKDLFHNRRRPRLDASATALSANLYVVSDDFLRAWRAFLRNPSMETVLDTNVDSVNGKDCSSSLLAGLLCDHGLLRWPLEQLDSQATLVTADEWAALLEASLAGVTERSCSGVMLSRHACTGHWQSHPVHCALCFQVGWKLNVTFAFRIV